METSGWRCERFHHCWPFCLDMRQRKHLDNNQLSALGSEGLARLLSDDKQNTQMHRLDQRRSELGVDFPILVDAMILLFCIERTLMPP
jgi:hypothetical protein